VSAEWATPRDVIAGRRWVSPAEAAAILGCHRQTIYDGVADGTVPHRRIGRTLRIPTWWLLGDDLRPGRATVPDAEPGTALTLLAPDDDEVTGDGIR